MSSAQQISNLTEKRDKMEINSKKKNEKTHSTNIQTKQ